MLVQVQKIQLTVIKYDYLLLSAIETEETIEKSGEVTDRWE